MSAKRKRGKARTEDRLDGQADVGLDHGLACRERGAKGIGKMLNQRNCDTEISQYRTHRSARHTRTWWDRCRRPPPSARAPPPRSRGRACRGWPGLRQGLGRLRPPARSGGRRAWWGRRRGRQQGRRQRRKCRRRSRGGVARACRQQASAATALNLRKGFRKKR